MKMLLILQARARTAHRLGYSLDRILLSDNARAEPLLHLEELFALAFHHLVDRDAGPAADHRGDVLAGDFLAQHGIASGGNRIGELFFKAGDGAILQLSRLGEIAGALRPLKREIEQIDQRLAALESERTALQAQLAGQPTPAQMADCGKRLKVGLDETQRLEERWLELSSELEGAAQGS